MPTSKADRSSEASGSPKRKLTPDATPGLQSSQPKRSRLSIADLLSPQGSAASDRTDSTETYTLSKKQGRERERKDDEGLKSNGSPSQPRTFVEMYTFTSRTKPNGVVDLTQTKPPISKQPLNGKKPFGSQQGGPRQLIVKNLRTTPRIDPQDFFDRKWKDQEAALDSLFAGGDVKILLEELYKATEHICRQGKGAELFERLRQKCIRHLDNDLRQPLVEKTRSSSAVESLEAFVDAWALWQKQLQTIRHAYFYLNQSYLIRSVEYGDINSVGLQLFKQTICWDPEIRPVCLDGALDLVQRERFGKDRKFDVLQHAISNFRDLGIYDFDFEPMLISSSERYFKSWKTEEAEKSDLPHYVRSCAGLLTEETSRCEKLALDRTTQARLVTLFDEIFVESNVERLSNEDDILDLLEQDMDEELAQTWALLSRRSHAQLMAPPFSKFIDTEGSVIVFDEKREGEMVVRLLAFKRKLDHICNDCFQKDDQVGNALHKAFETFMNRSKKSQSNWDTDNAKPGEMIAKHIDLLLKGGSKAIPKLKDRKPDAPEAENEQDFDEEENDDSSIEKHLADALDLFRFVHGKAVFEAFYKKDLARRLLMGRTQSFDAERSMLTRLRNECGANFTHNLESMFKDMELAREEMRAYLQILSDREITPKVDLSVNVLSVAAWPTYPDVPVNVPPSIASAQASFEKHYKDKHVGRKLTWKPSLAHCQLRSRFLRGNKELVVSGFQAIVLLLFNDVTNGETLSYEQIKSTTNLPDSELKRTLQSLACAKYRVLMKTPKGRDVNETDVFAFNEKFSDPKLRIKINQIQLKETKEENKETHQRVAADRHYETQAAIVRIMKASKRIGHNELIVEVIKATRSRGVLDQVDIKKNIEKLIEKEYMERDDEIRGYSYLA